MSLPESGKKTVLNEFKEDLQKQCVMLMGLPAAGKSTFIEQGMSKYIPAMKGYKTTNSDVQLKGLQYNVAKSHFDWLKKNAKTQVDIEKFVRMTRYHNHYKGSITKVPVTLHWWNTHKDQGVKYFYKTFNKDYYATYFDVRDMAISNEKALFDTKIKEAGNLIIIDTTGSNTSKAEARFKTAHKEGFTTTVVYLEIDVDLAIARDDYREKTQGRGVGSKVIEGYAKKMESALKTYIAEGKKEDGYVDRLLHMIWVGGARPDSGTFNLVKEYKFSLQRRKKALAKKEVKEWLSRLGDL